MEKQNQYDVTATSGTSKVVIPADTLEIIELYYGGSTLSRIPLHEILACQETGELGTPRYFSREHGDLRIHPAPTSGTLHLNYYAEQAVLDSDSDTNMLTVIASDLLTYTALSYAADYFLDERGAIFDQKSGSFLAEIQEHADSAEQSGINQTIRPTHYYED
jgi:hypothetical protein